LAQNSRLTLIEALEVYGEYDAEQNNCWYHQQQGKFYFKPTRELPDSPLSMIETIYFDSGVKLKEYKKARLQAALQNSDAVCFAYLTPKGSNRIQKIEARDWKHLQINLESETIQGCGEIYVSPEFAVPAKITNRPEIAIKRGPRSPKENSILSFFEDLVSEGILKPGFKQKEIAQHVIKRAIAKGHRERGFSENNVIKTLREKGKFKALKSNK
jgi:hypothetical protein